MSESGGRGSRGKALQTARRMAAAVTAGLLVGLVIGGFGGRIAMLVLRLTSDSSLHGFKTDDGFTIGIVSGQTMFLLIVTTLGGAVGGLSYLLVRSWLPPRLRPWLFGSLAAVVGGARIIRPDGIDFTKVEPLGLAVVMFVAIPAAYGVATSVLAERFLREDSAFYSSRASLAVLLILLPLAALFGALFGAPALLIVATIVVFLLLTRSGLLPASAWSSAPVRWLGTAGLIALGVASTVELARDVSAIL